jgi:phosphohistidine phosphatase
MGNKEDDILQAGCVPCRFRKGQLEICMITTRKGRWGFPKGIIDPGETPEETALKESVEEAGLIGKIQGKSIGSYRYRKWGVELVCTMFIMKVTMIEDSWDEAWRQREWFSPDAAREIIDREELLPFVDVAAERLLNNVTK